MKNVLRSVTLAFSLFLTACGFHPQGSLELAPPLHSLYLQTSDPYGTLSRNLRDHLKTSHVKLVDSAKDASAVLEILNDSATQELLSVAGTQQTRQYKLIVSVTFSVSDNKGRTLLAPQTLRESRTITVQANQILGSSNEATLYMQQMRRMLAYAIMNRLASTEATNMINAGFPVKKR